MPTGEKEYATICGPCGQGDEAGNLQVNGVAGRRVDQSKVGRIAEESKAMRGEEQGKGGRGESCVSKVEALCSKAGIAARVLGACSRPAAFCEGSRSRRRRRSAKEKHYVGGRAWPEKEEGLKWRSSLPGRRGRRLGRKKGWRRERKKGGRREGVEGAMECNCRRVEVGEVMEERQVIRHFFALYSWRWKTKVDFLFVQVRKKTCGVGGPGGGVYAGNGQKVTKTNFSFSSLVFITLCDLQDFDVAIEKKSGRSGLW